MAITNHERVGEALEFLRQGLGPFAEREFVSVYKAEVARELAARLDTLCERKQRAAEALSYHGLVQSWPEITRLAAGSGKAGGPTQQALL